MNNLINLIIKLGITQKQFADEIQVDESSLSQIINGKYHLKDNLIIRICKSFNVSADWLLGIESSDKFRCYYVKRKQGWISGCGWRVGYNKHWVYCPHCGKHIINLNREQENRNGNTSSSSQSD